MAYEIDQIFEGAYTPEVAEWCNSNNAYIEEIERANDVRRFQIKAIPQPDFEELKTLKLNELTSKGHAFDSQLVNTDMYIVSSLGFKVNADLRSQNNIRSLIDSVTDTVLFNDYNNVFRKLNKEQLQTLLKECIENGQALYVQKWKLAQLINDCNTQEELDSIEITFTMADYSI